MLMTGLCLVLVASLVYSMTKARPIYCIPGLTTAGVAYPQENPESTVAIFTASWALNWSNFTPATVEDVYKHAQLFMSPRLLNQTKTRLKRDIDQVKSNNISSMFSLNQNPQVQEEEDGVKDHQSDEPNPPSPQEAQDGADEEEDGHDGGRGHVGPASNGRAHHPC